METARGQQQQAEPGAAALAAAAEGAPPAVPVGTKFPVEGLMGAVEAIQEFQRKQAEEHRKAQGQPLQEVQPTDDTNGVNGSSCAQGSAGDAGGGGGSGTQADDSGSADGKPLGYPGTFFLEKPLTGEAAHTLTRMWQPPGGGYPPYPGYPTYPGGAPPQQPQYPGYPPAGAAPAAQPAGGAYPQVHHAAPAPSGPGGMAAAAAPYPGAYQQQAADTVPRPVPPAAVAGGRKKAFICGINYFGTSAQLRGCINDAKCMEYLLKTKFGFRQENILMMTDDCPDPLRRPTKANMLQGFRWLMMDLKPGDSLVFHFSGHGSQQRDYSGEETDGMNETLCPLDFKQAGEIVDDDLNRMLINPLPTGVKLHAIIDACHSGSVMDLPYQAHVRGGYARWEASYHYTRSHKGTAGGFAVQFGAAKDSQTAADTQALAGNTSTGAATFCFIQAIERRGTKLTYGELLIAMHNTLQERMGPAAQAPAASGGLLGMLLGGAMMAGGGGYRGQEPVLSSNYAFDLAFPFGL